MCNSYAPGKSMVSLLKQASTSPSKLRERIDTQATWFIKAQYATGRNLLRNYITVPNKCTQQYATGRNLQKKRKTITRKHIGVNE
jgi:hypothetical protein